MDELHANSKLAGIDFDSKGEHDHDSEKERRDQGDEAEGGEEGL